MLLVMLLGPPGAGKGTQSSRICDRYGIRLVSTGNILREAAQAETPEGKAFQRTIAAGRLVGDDEIIQLVLAKLNKRDSSKGCLFDGFPRTIPQAEALEAADVLLDCVLEIDVPDDHIVNRMSGRLFHPKSGRSYHNSFNPPKTPGKDDLSGEDLVQREDDRPDIVRQRLSVYRAQTRPLADYYKRKSEASNRLVYRKISGLGEIDEVTQRIFQVLDHLPLRSSVEREREA